MSLRLEAMLDDAARQDLRVGEMLGAGGYSLVFACDDGAVLKVPWVTQLSVDEHPDVVPRGWGPQRIELASATGPFELRRNLTVDDAAALLARACERQSRAASGCPLPGLLATPTLCGLPAALYERLDGPDFATLPPARAQASVPRVAAALAALHDTFGAHGDLKPAHIFAGGERVRFIDPLIDEPWLGSIGYMLPAPYAWRGDAFFRDLLGLTATLAEPFGVDLAFGGRLAYLLINQNNGRFGRGLDLPGFLEGTRERVRPLPPPLAAFTLAVIGAFVDGWLGRRPTPPTGASRRALLDALAAGRSPPDII